MRSPLVQTFGTTDCNPGSAGESVFPPGEVVPGDKSVPDALTSTYYRAFGPRVGLAWSPSADSGFWHKLFGSAGRTSIRAGYGIFYNPVEQLVLEQFSAEPPFGGSSFFCNPLFNTPFLAQNGTVVPNPFNGILDPPRGQPLDWSRFRPDVLFGEFQPHLRTQYAEQYNFTIQRQLRGDTLLQIAYVGSQGHRLLASHDLNYGLARPCLDLNQLSTLANDARRVQQIESPDYPILERVQISHLRQHPPTLCRWIPWENRSTFRSWVPIVLTPDEPHR